MLETVQFNAKNAPFCFFLFFIKFFRGGGGGGMPPDLPSRLGASRRRSSDNTDKICSGLAPLQVLVLQGRLAANITEEQGKTLVDAEGDVLRGLRKFADVFKYI